jgi:NADH:ubiquinone oxidoreductase subunit 2 (subunit N)
MAKIYLFSGISSIIVGAYGALYSKKLFEFLAYTGVNNTGFVLLGMGTNSYCGIIASLFYLSVYLVSLLALLLLLQRYIYLNSTHIKDLIFLFDIGDLLQNKSLSSLNRIYLIIFV